MFFQSEGERRAPANCSQRAEISSDAQARKALRRHFGDDLLEVLGAACLHDEFDLHALHRQRTEGALVPHFVDVRAEYSERTRDFRQGAGNVANVHAQPRQARRANHAALNDFGENERLDIAPRQHDADAPPRKARTVAQQRRQAYRAGAFDDSFFDFEQQHDRLFDVVFADEQHVVDVLVNHSQRQGTGVLDGDAVGDRCLAALAVAAVHRVPGRRKAFGLHADDLNSRAQRTRRGGDAADQAAAAHRNQQRVQRGLLGQHLQCERALARGESLLGPPDPKTLRRPNTTQIDDYFKRKDPNADPVLTKREQEVLQHFANGKSTVEVARTLTISQKTVKNHLTSIYQKLNVRHRTEAVLLGLGFTKEAFEMKAESLSGGEKNRLGLARLLLKGALI